MNATLKKIIALALTVAITAAVAITGTIAYLTIDDAGHALNTITVGDISVKVTEDVSATTGSADVQQNADGAAYTSVMPGDYLGKEVTVTNDGSNDAYVVVTVTMNNADKINSAIDAVYEGAGYNDGAIQAMYDLIFDGWGLNYTKVDADGNALGMRLTITGDDMPEHVLYVDTVKAMPDYIQFANGVNQFRSEAEKATVSNFTAGLKDSYYSLNQYLDNGEKEAASQLGAYEIRNTYYIKLPAGESTTLFNGMKVPEEFNAAQLAMFSGLEIDIQSAAIQADNLAPEQAFDILANGGDTYVEQVSTIEDLENALEAGGYVQLMDDIAITPDTVLNRGNYIAAIFNDTTLDLNGHDISFDLGEDKAGSSPRMFYVYSGALTIVGDGNLSVTNDAAVAWVTSQGGSLNIYGGNYVSDNYVTGDPNDVFAIIYSSGGEVNVYGGTFTYGNMPGGTNGGFNVQDWWGHKITLHEGVLLSNEVYRQPQDTSAFRIRLAENCGLVPVEIDGQTWYQVTKAAQVSNTGELTSALNEGGYILLADDITADGTASVEVPEGVNAVLDLNGKTITNPVVGAPALVNNGTLTITGDGAVVNGVNSTKASHTIVNNGTLVIKSGNIGTDDTAGAAVVNYGTTTINGGTFASKQENVKGDGLCAYAFINQSGTMTITDATLNGQTHGLFGAYGGTITVKGGKYTMDGNGGLGCYVVYATGEGKVELLGDEIIINTNEPRSNRVFFVYDNGNYFNAAAVETGKVVVNGATINLNGVAQSY